MGGGGSEENPETLGHRLLNHLFAGPHRIFENLTCQILENPALSS